MATLQAGTGVQVVQLPDGSWLITDFATDLANGDTITIDDVEQAAAGGLTASVTNTGSRRGLLLRVY